MAAATEEKSQSSSRHDTRVTLEFTGLNVFDQFKCPICDQVPDGLIYQCKNGHILCHRCSKNILACPQCRVILLVDGGYIRNRAMESLMDSLLFPCPFQSKGCSEIVRRQDLKSHEINCKFNGKRVQICKHLGYACKFPINTLDVDSSVDHFVRNHSAIVSYLNVKLRIDDIVKTLEILKPPPSSEGQEKLSLKAQDGMWEPIIFRLERGVYAMLVVFVNGEDNSLAFSSFLLSDYSGRPAPLAKLFIISYKQNVPTLFWTVETILLTQSEEILKQAPVKISLPLILQNYLTDKSLILECSYEKSPSIVFPKPKSEVPLVRLVERQKLST